MLIVRVIVLRKVAEGLNRQKHTGIGVERECAHARRHHNPTADEAAAEIVTQQQTLLYGFAGSLRNLNLFESSLTYNFESNNYLGMTASYKNGYDEDTAIRVQTWTVGFTARY